MKKNTPLWGSISLLVGIVIAILALTKDAVCTVLLITAFTLWGLWVVLAQVFPARRAARLTCLEQNTQPDAALKLTLLHHVNYRISGCLKSAYPGAQWEWVMPDPASFVAQGGTGRIRVFGIPDYGFVDVTLDRNGKLTCSLVQVAPLDGKKEDHTAPAQTPLDPHIWYETQASDILAELVADLASRGHHSLTLKEDGSICTRPADGNEETAHGTLPSFPDKVYWPGLAQVLEQNGLAATIKDTGIIVAW